MGKKKRLKREKKMRRLAKKLGYHMVTGNPSPPSSMPMFAIRGLMETIKDMMEQQKPDGANKPKPH